MSRDSFIHIVEYVLDFYMKCGYTDFPDIFEDESSWNQKASDLINVCDMKGVWIYG